VGGVEGYVRSFYRRRWIRLGFFTLQNAMNFLGLTTHYTDKYLHWRCTKEDALELRMLYEKLVMRTDVQDVEELIAIIERQTEQRERDRLQGL
jgi:hypothetical protein